MSKVKAGEAYVEIGGDPRKLFAALGKVNRQIGKIGSSMASAGTKMAAVGGAIVAPILGAAQAFASVGSALDDMSKRTGVAAESLSVLKFAAEQTGTDMAGVETAVKKMQKAIYAAGHGSKEAASALEMVGLSASDLAGLSADQQMGKIADGLMAIEDPGTRAAVAMQIFGKAGTMILPMLEGGSAGMAAFAAEAKRLGLVMDSETAAKADSLGDAIDALEASMKMAFIQVGSAVAPIITKIAQVLAVAAAAVGKFITENKDLVVTALKVGAALVTGGASLYALGKGISFASGAFGVILQALKLFPVALSVAFGPIGLFAAAVAGVVMLGPQLKTAFGGVFNGLGAAAESVGGVFSTMASDAAVVFGDLANTATTTFNGIYDAIANGDLSGAMDILWAGLQAGWLRGVEALMSYVDPWISMFQNTFTYLGTEIMAAWDTMTTYLASTTWGATLLGVVDNLVNGVLAAFDGMVAAVRKSWNWVQSFFKEGFDLEKENKKVDSEMTARARRREVARPGVNERVRRAKADNGEMKADSEKRVAAMRAQADATAQGREEQNRKNVDARRAATQAAEGRLSGLTRGQSEQRTFRAQADDAIGRLGSANTMEQVREIADEFHLLASTGRLTAEQQKKYADAVEAAQDRIESTRGEAGVGGTGTVDPAELKRAAAEAAASQSEVAGTFSAASVSSMGFGASLAQKQLDEQKRTNRILEEKLGEGAVAA